MTRETSVLLIATLIELTDTVEGLTGINDKETLRRVTNCLLREFIVYLSIDEAWQELLQEITVQHQKSKEKEDS